MLHGEIGLLIVMHSQSQASNKPISQFWSVQIRGYRQMGKLVLTNMLTPGMSGLLVLIKNNIHGQNLKI